MIVTAPAGRDTLVTLTQLNLGADSPIPDIIEENIKYCPEAGLFPVDTIPGTAYPALIRTGLPTAQFRKYNQGVEPSSGTYRTVEVQTSIVDTRVECDKRYADSYHRGAAGWQAIKASEQLEAIMRLIGATTYYGADNNPEGFPGFWDLVDPAMKIPMGGEVQADGFRSSVWAVKVGIQDVKHVYGNNKTLDLNPDWRVESFTPDPTKPTKKIDGYVNQWGGHPGLQVLSKHSIACVANVTSDAGGLVTMETLRDLLECFPNGVVPDYIMLTRKTRRQLRDSLKTSLIPNPPTPEDVDGVPFVITDSIRNDEPLVFA